MRLWVQSLASLSGLRIWSCCELWCRPAAVAPIWPLAWELPYATGAALKRKENNNFKNKIIDSIKKAIELYEVGDLIIIAGKGHENYQIKEDKKYFFDDKLIAKKILDEKE